MRYRVGFATFAILATHLFGAVPLPAAAQGAIVKVTVDGVERTALVFPGKNATTTPSPVVFLFHGAAAPGSTAEQHANRVSRYHRFHEAWPEATVVYPVARQVIYPGFSLVGWQFAPGDFGDRDGRFVDALYEKLATAYRVDERRVYATGFQVGAWFTYALLLTRPERFAAFAPVDGCNEPFARWARVPRPVLVLTDRYGCGRKPLLEERQITWMRRLNGAGTQTREWAPNYFSFEPSESGQPVIWHRSNANQEWTFAYSRNIARFFQEHPLPDLPRGDRPVDLPADGVVAGNGTSGYRGSRGPATAAQLSFPEGLAMNSTGDLFVADMQNNLVRRVGADGILSDAAGSGQWRPAEAAADDRPSDTRQAERIHLRFPSGVVVDRQDNLLIVDTYSARIRKVSPDGTAVTLVGDGVDGFAGDGSPAVQARLYYPTAAALDPSGNLFIADTGNQRIRKVDPTGVITTYAGAGAPGFAGDGGDAKQARLHEPRGLAVDRDGNLFIADSYNHRVRKVSPDGTITTVAGTGTRGFAGDGGHAKSAQLDGPEGVAVDSAGNLFIADSANHRVRKVTPDGIITTVAGGAEGTFVAVPLRYPEGLAIDRTGNLYIADPLDHRVRKAPSVAAPGLLAGQAFPDP
jgi:sugar lactone lactonase YvrE